MLDQQKPFDADTFLQEAAQYTHAWEESWLGHGGPAPGGRRDNNHAEFTDSEVLVRQREAYEALLAFFVQSLRASVRSGQSKEVIRFVHRALHAVMPGSNADTMRIELLNHILQDVLEGSADSSGQRVDDGRRASGKEVSTLLDQ